MKRRFRITITPDNSWKSFTGIQYWVEQIWSVNFNDDKLLFKGSGRPQFCAGIEIFDKTAKSIMNPDVSPINGKSA